MNGVDKSIEFFINAVKQSILFNLRPFYQLVKTSINHTLLGNKDMR